jgi:serine/threonine protein kinase
MLVGKFPFRATNEPELYRIIANGKYKYRDENISDQAKRFISKMLTVKAEERATAEQLLQDVWMN